MSEPKNHHWLPRFLQRKWADSCSGKVLCIHRPHSNIKSTWLGTRQLGSTKGLYTVTMPGYKNPQFVETSFMSKVVDEPAAEIHEKMLNDQVEALGFEERQRWTLFMLLLKVRHPDAIQPKQKTQEESWKEFFIKTYTGLTPTGYTQPLDWDETEALYNQRFAGSGSDMVLQALVAFLLDSPYFNQIMTLEWRVLHLHDTERYFCLGDNPVIINPFIKMEGTESIIKSVWMPLSPDALFVAGEMNYFTSPIIFLDKLRPYLANKVIFFQFSQARRFVIVRNQGEIKTQWLVRMAEKNGYLRKSNESAAN